MRKASRQQGFTITEVLVALILIAIIFTFVMLTLTKGLASRNKAEARLHLAEAENAFLEDFTVEPLAFSDMLVATADAQEGNLYTFYYARNFSEEIGSESEDYITIRYVSASAYCTIDVQGYRSGKVFGLSLSRKVAAS